jgi:hypothetical protein
MAVSRMISALVLGALIAAVPLKGRAQKLADGNSWVNSPEEQRRAYMVALSDVVAAGNAHDRLKLPGQEDTAMRRAYQGFSGVSMEEAIRTVDAWYRSHPDQLAQPVLAVLWREIGKPRLAARK